MSRAETQSFDRLWHLCSIAKGAWLVYMYSAGTPLTKWIMVVVVVPLIEGVCIMVGVV